MTPSPKRMPIGMMSRSSEPVRRSLRRCLNPPAIAAALFLMIGSYGVFVTPDHRDEDVYVWASAYLMHQLATHDTSFTPDDEYSDPHWYWNSHWVLGMGTSTRLVYGAGLVLTPGTEAPQLPYSWEIARFQGPNTIVAPRTRTVMRFVAVLCGALGIALIARRFRWAAVIGAAVILFVPGGIATFSRAWAEGPLLLGFGLCAAAYGTRWFAPALGLALTFKLNALLLWPLVFLRRARVIPLWQALVAMVGVFMLLTPPSLVQGGPIYIKRLIEYRLHFWSLQSSEKAFLPSRYFWPFELAAVLAGAWLVSRLLAHRRGLRAVREAPPMPRGEAVGQAVGQKVGL